MAATASIRVGSIFLFLTYVLFETLEAVVFILAGVLGGVLACWLAVDGGADVVEGAALGGRELSIREPAALSFFCCGCKRTVSMAVSDAAAGKQQLLPTAATLPSVVARPQGR
jgi:hypothetical protein